MARDGLYGTNFCSSITRADHVYHISLGWRLDLPTGRIRRRSRPDQSGHSSCGESFRKRFLHQLQQSRRPSGGRLGRNHPASTPSRVWWIGPEWGFRWGQANREVLFGLHGWAEGLLFLANSVGYPGDLISIHTGGELEVLWSDQWEENAGHNTSDEVHFGIDEVLQPGPGGKAFRTLAMPPRRVSLAIGCILLNLIEAVIALSAGTPKEVLKCGLRISHGPLTPWPSARVGSWEMTFM